MIGNEECAYSVKTIILTKTQQSNNLTLISLLILAGNNLNQKRTLTVPTFPSDQN